MVPVARRRGRHLCNLSFPIEGMQNLSPFFMAQFKFEALITKWFSGL
jgi:hypothetical protein